MYGLSKEVTLQTYTQTASASGQRTKTWHDLSTVMAGVLPMRGDERMRAQAETPKMSHRVIIRWRGDVTPKMRIQYPDGTRNRYLHIEQVIDPEERHVRLELLCSEYVDG